MLRLSEVELSVDALDEAVDAYDRVFGRSPALRGVEGGRAFALYRFDDSSFILRERQASASGEAVGRAHLTGFVLDTADLASLRRRLRRLSLSPTGIETHRRIDAASGVEQRWQSFRVDAPIAGALSIAFRQSEGQLPVSPATTDAPVAGLDLIVIATQAPERLAAFLGAYLGLEMVLDRQMPGGARLMQFMAGKPMIEVVHREPASPDAPARADRIWGISWQVDDIDAMQARMKAAGLNASDVKTGAKPGTRVFTLRDGTCGVPTLVMQWVADDGSPQPAS